MREYTDDEYTPGFKNLVSENKHGYHRQPTHKDEHSPRIGNCDSPGRSKASFNQRLGRKLTLRKIQDSTSKSAISNYKTSQFEEISSRKYDLKNDRIRKLCIKSVNSSSAYHYTI